MQITRTSTYSGTINTQEIEATHEQLDAWRSGVSIQVAFPHLSADEREFIMTGVTAEEWSNEFGDDDEDQIHDRKGRAGYPNV